MNIALIIVRQVCRRVSWLVVIHIFLVLYWDSVDSLGATRLYADHSKIILTYVLFFISVLILHVSPVLYSHSIYKDMFALRNLTQRVLIGGSRPPSTIVTKVLSSHYKYLSVSFDRLGPAWYFNLSQVWKLKGLLNFLPLYWKYLKSVFTIFLVICAIRFENHQNYKNFYIQFLLGGNVKLYRLLMHVCWI